MKRKLRLPFLFNLIDLGYGMAICRVCLVELVINENWILGQSKRNNKICDKCRKISRRNSYLNNKAEYKQYYEDNKESILIKSKTRYDENREPKLEYQSNYYIENREKVRNYQREHESKLEIKIKTNTRRKNKRRNDINYRISCNLRTRMWAAIKNNQKMGSAVTDLGISVEAFKMYIEAQFEIGMDWDNWGEIWEIDHIKPLCQFDLTDRDQFLEAANWMNQRPLWAIDNSKKAAEDKKKSIWSVYDEKLDM